MTMWELCDATGPVRSGLDTAEARDLVYANADPAVFARQGKSEIRWDDVKDTAPTEGDT
jgi:hypothetical protein